MALAEHPRRTSHSTDHETAVHFGHWVDYRWSRPQAYPELVADMVRAMDNTYPHHSHRDQTAGVLLSMAESARYIALQPPANRERLGAERIADPRILSATLYEAAYKIAGDYVAAGGSETAQAKACVGYQFEALAGLVDLAKDEQL